MNKKFILAMVFLILYLASFPILPPTITRNDFALTAYVAFGFIAVIFALVSSAKSKNPNWG